MTRRTSSRSTSATCGARSTFRSVATRSVLCAGSATGWTLIVRRSERRRFWFSTLRVRTAVTAGAVVGAALLIAAFVLVGILHHAMVNGVDGAIALRADDVAAAAASGQLPERLAGGIDDDTVAQVYKPSGRSSGGLVAQS